MTRKPTTAYDFHRAITLVRVLASSGHDEPIRQLCIDWNVEPVEDRSIPPYRGVYYIHAWATIRKLAIAALQHAREGGE